MSELLINSDRVYHHHFQLNQDWEISKPQSVNYQEEFAKFDVKLLKYLEPHREFTQVTTLEDTRSKTYTVLFHKIARNYKGLLSFVYKKLQAKVSIFFHLIDQKGNYFKLPTTSILISFVKSGQIFERNSQFPLKLMVNYNSLEVLFEVIYFSPSNSNLIYDMQSTNKYQNIILTIYKNFIQRNISGIQNVLRIFALLQYQKEQEQQNSLVQNFYRYATLMTIKTNFLVGEIVSEQTRSKHLQQREQSSRKLLTKKIYIAPEQLKSFQLFSNYKIINKDKAQENKNYFYISEVEEKVIRKEIAFQFHKGVQDKKKNYETFLNPIKIYEPQKIVKYKFNQGGFSQLFLADVKFWMASSLSQTFSTDVDTKNLIKKVLVMKKQFKQNGKILHQTRILTQLKSMYIPFLPKYYLPLNLVDNSIDKNPLLMMDMLTHGNLADFMKKNRKSTSLNSKIVLMFSLTIALRLLDKYKIVHLDLKPNNIMMSSNLSIKIIDFGEAYHQQVAKSQGANYLHGITLPYSPPEALTTQNGRYTNKSDIFSLGVIFYELMFQRRPFENIQQFLLSPEQCDNFAEIKIVRVMNWVISRCLSSNLNDRPELEWISMILKTCMYLVTQRQNRKLF